MTDDWFAREVLQLCLLAHRRLDALEVPRAPMRREGVTDHADEQVFPCYNQAHT